MKPALPKVIVAVSQTAIAGKVIRSSAVFVERRALPLTPGDRRADLPLNVDHVISGRRGDFLLETKNLASTVTFEDGCLTARQLDDPDEVYRYTSLGNRVRGQAAELSERIGLDRGRAPWVQGVVVIWGHFPAGHVEENRVVYIHGDRLREWLEPPNERSRVPLLRRAVEPFWNAATATSRKQREAHIRRRGAQR